MKKKMLALLFAVCILVSTLLTSCGTSSSSSYESWSTDAPLKMITLKSTETQITRTPTPYATFTPTPTLPPDSADLSTRIIIPTNTPEAVAATVVLTDPAIPPEVQKLLNPEYKAVYDQAHSWWVITDRYGRGSQLFLTEKKIFVKMKPGSLVKIDEIWYRYDRNIGKLIEWDVWEPVVSESFTGTVSTADGQTTIDVPVSIGLMPDLVERLSEPVTGFSRNPEWTDEELYPELAKYIMRMCWHNYKENNPDQAGISFDDYLREVAAGRGEVTFAAGERQDAGWTTGSGTLSIIKKSPKNGIEVYFSDTIGGRYNNYGGYISFNENDHLTIVFGMLPPADIKDVKQTSIDTLDKITGFKFSQCFTHVYRVLFDADPIKAAAAGGYWGSSVASASDYTKAVGTESAKIIKMMLVNNNPNKFKPFWLADQAE